MANSNKPVLCTYDERPAVARVTWYQYGGASKTVRVCEEHRLRVVGSRHYFIRPLENSEQSLEIRHG